jgi:hypothetical protein
MKRIDSFGIAEDLHGTGKHGFTDGDPVGGVPATIVAAEFLNGAQEEIAGVIERVMPLAPHSQLANALGFAFGVLATSTLHKIIEGPCGLRDAATTESATTHIIDASGVLRRASNGTTPSGLEAVVFTGIVSRGHEFVAVGNAGAIWSTMAGTYAARVADAGFEGNFTDIADGAGLYVAIGSGGEIQTSPNGIAWTHQESDGSIDNLVKVVYSRVAHRWLVHGTSYEDTFISSSSLQWSDDGVDWTDVDTQPGVVHDIGESLAGGFFARIANGSYYESADGVSWTLVAPPGYNPQTGTGQGWIVSTSEFSAGWIGIDPRTPAMRLPPSLPFFRRLIHTRSCWVAATPDGDVYLSVGLPF